MSALPLAILIASVVVLIGTYPRSVYLWGDEIERYRQMLKKRAVAWTVVVGIVVTGLGANLLSAGLLRR
jgi:hypothetical protein